MSTDTDAMPAAPLHAPPRPLVPPRPAVPPPPAGPPAGPRPSAARTVAAAVCLVVGIGLIGGAAAGSWLAAPAERSAAQRTFDHGATVWREVPVDTLFPPSVHADAAGPGGAARDWTRTGVAPDGDCTGGFDAPLESALAPAGCRRLLRATYTDATSSTVTTVGVLVTDTDAAGMRELRDRFAHDGLTDRVGVMPRAYAPPGTAAAGFGDAQRASWQLTVLTDLPAVVFAVTGFADGRTGVPPEPAERAVAPGATSVPAQAGLGHDARALAGALTDALRTAARKGAR
ncbi:hypothetical protein GCM10010218_21790 [Streptomyces mashuensis]|uniref:Uncharacterized protein n=1 Tax=Streptomyces mashuensis TaxID=33904 RepID=A0A919EB61_9ACTN|nr:hypothetical protein [Streptomyces mashuensis]GHF40075.1 hypothetical protein GCM10010218_21790 [Streptomyces mashuensis]